MAAAVKRVIPLGVNYGISLSKLRGNYNVSNVPAASLLVNRSQYCAEGYNVKCYGSLSSKSSAHSKFDCRQMSQLVKANGKRAFLVDTLALVKSLEAQGVPSKQAEAITSAITEVLNDSLENIACSFVSLAEMQKSDLVQEANISKFKSQIQSSQFSHCRKIIFLYCNMKLKSFGMTLKKYEIDKLTAGQRLDLNLERGSIRDELAKQNAETTNLTNKLDREIHALRAQLEAGKYEVIKYCIGTLVSISAVGLAVLRLYA
ncbi:protein FMP32, mitochondrial-like isoform X2 [Nicotiana sylvestris]|uniref:protein FMP32, mitochondrial-like isoform X2 n=1 Tax=Nicotiana sylvestris TaxID=4096 RepID=UPI00388C552B